MICMGNLTGVFFSEEGHIETHKISFFPYKQVSGRHCDHEWLRMTNGFILCDLLWKVQKGHAANRKGSFKIVQTNFCDDKLYIRVTDNKQKWDTLFTIDLS